MLGIKKKPGKVFSGKNIKDRNQLSKTAASGRDPFAAVFHS